MKTLQKTFQELLRYPSAIAGLIIIAGLVALSIYAVVSIPYKEAIRLWRGGQDVWYATPKYAPPAWLNFFHTKKEPVTMDLNSAKGQATITTKPQTGMNEKLIVFDFDYTYDGFPPDMTLYFTTKYVQKEPYVSISWVTPQGNEIRVADFAASQSEVYPFSQDTKLQRRLNGMPPQNALFVLDPSVKDSPVNKGHYQLKIDALTFEDGSDVNAEFVLYGKLYGWAGTDHLRRDLGVALLWGTPIALSFGLLAAMGTTLITMIIAAFGVWYSGWVDEIIQRITEVNLVLPFLPILIMVGTFYSHSIWLMLGVTILLSIFGSSIKTYRAVFMQTRESPYIEAARAYGASNLRIIFQYMVPRLIPLLIPQLVVLVPSFVFLEAGLAVLGLGDPVLPTWGKVIQDAQANGALYQGLYYWVLEPAFLLIVAGLAFALLGFSLDRIFNPRLRGL